MEAKRLDLMGCYLYDLRLLGDRRGSFLKTMHLPSLEGTPLFNFRIEEEFYTVSRKNVLRGLHFQEPPFAHDKLVVCLGGSVKDFFLDMRKDSPSYGKTQEILLDSRTPQLLYLPKGIAHGFLAQEDDSALLYKTNKAYSPEYDRGIHWTSLSLDLPISNQELIISDRDEAFPIFDDYRSPF